MQRKTILLVENGIESLTEISYFESLSQVYLLQQDSFNKEISFGSHGTISISTMGLGISAIFVVTKII